MLDKSKWSDDYIEPVKPKKESFQGYPSDFDPFAPPPGAKLYDGEILKKTGQLVEVSQVKKPKRIPLPRKPEKIIKPVKDQYDLIRELQPLMGFDYTQGNFTAFNERTKKYNNIKHKVTQSTILMHLTNDATISLTQHAHTKMFLIDIDQRNNTVDANKIVDTIAKEFNIKLRDMIAEYSYDSGGYHLYIKFDKYLTKDCKKYIEKYFKETHSFTVEVKKGDEGLKLPFSKKYRLCGFYDRFQAKSIVPLVYENTCVDDLLYIFKELREVKVPSFILKENKEGHPVKNYRNGEYRIIDNYFSQEKIKEWYGYGCGTRYHTQRKLARYCYSYGLSYTEFYGLCEVCNDDTSKDMADYTVKDKKIREAWKYGTGNHVQLKMFDPASCEKPTGYIYQRLKINEKLKEKLDYILKATVKMNNIGVYDRNKLRIVQDTLKVYEQMYFRQKYNQEKNLKYIDEEMEGLEEGVAFGIEMFRMIHKEFNLKTDIHLIKRVLILSGLISVLRNKEGYTYSYKALRYVKHWKLNNVEKLYKFYLSLYTKSYKNSIYNINKSNILINNINNTYFFLQVNYIFEFLNKEKRYREGIFELE